MIIAWLMAVLSGGWRSLVYPTYKKLGDAEWRERLPYMQEAGLWTATMACCLAGPFTSFTILRNQEWSDPMRLWESAHAGSPNKLRVLYNLGVSHASAHRQDDAEVDFTNAIQVGESKLEKHQFRSDEGVEIKCFHLAYLDLARMQLIRFMKSGRTGDYAQSIASTNCSERDWSRATYDPDLALGYAQFQHDLGRYYQALPVLQKSLAMHTWAEQLYFPLGVALLETGDPNNAVQMLNMASAVRDKHTTGVELGYANGKRVRNLRVPGTRPLPAERLRDRRGRTYSARSESDPHGVTLMLMIANSAQNPALHPVELNSPDPFIEICLTRTRRDLLMQLVDCADRALRSGKVKGTKTMVENLRGAIASELKRRADIQKKRIDFGMTDDPDDIVEPKK